MFQLVCYQDFGTQRTHLCGKMKLQIWLKDSSFLNRNTQNTQTYHGPELPPSITSENLMVGKDDLFFWMVAFQRLLLNFWGYIYIYIYVYRYTDMTKHSTIYICTYTHYTKTDTHTHTHFHSYKKPCAIRMLESPTFVKLPSRWVEQLEPNGHI